MLQGFKHCKIFIVYKYCIGNPDYTGGIATTLLAGQS